MRNLFGWTSICFAGGVFGGLVNSVFLWMAGAYGWTAALDVALAPQWTLAWLYPRLIWGGLWGLLFLPHMMTRRKEHSLSGNTPLSWAWIGKKSPSPETAQVAIWRWSRHFVLKRRRYGNPLN